MERKNKITTGKQFKILVAELERNPTLVKGAIRGTNLYNFKQDWEEIAIKLNAVGPPKRDIDGWLKVWRDFKHKLKKKLLQKEAEMNGTGKLKNIILHPVEVAAAKLITTENQLNTESPALETPPALEEIKTEILDHSIWEVEEETQSGNPSVLEDMKTDEYCILDHTFLGDEELLPSTSTVNSYQVQMLGSPDRGKRKRNRKNDQRRELLEKHDAMQQKVFSEISNTMKDLKSILKDVSQYQQKLLEVEEKKLKIMQKQHEREEQLFESEMKLKILEMRIKTKELEALEKPSTL